ncbi:MAG: phytoene desaturase [Myxococcales bacterium]|nr:phytoene desaturase [Myxococcales bacterium]
MIAVVGAGVGGLCAALDLVGAGHDVMLFERAAAVGGKMHRVAAGGRAVDGGPTVLTMRDVFDGLFADAGADLSERVRLEPARHLARHAWPDGGRLDLHADPGASRRAIRAFAGEADAAGFDRFIAYARALHADVEDVFIRAQRPTAWRVLQQLGLRALPRLLRIDARRTMWQSLGDFFRDPRLRQLFGRYATYAGLDPFQAPATFNLIAWVEQAGVWRVGGGLSALAEALADLFIERGGMLRCGEGIATLRVQNGRVTGVTTERGEAVSCEAVVFNGDAQALAAGLLGEAARAAVEPSAPAARSLSALTFCTTTATQGFPLLHHNVFFSTDSAAEFRALFADRRLPDEPTVYVCAQDRGDDDAARAEDRLLLLVNAPATGVGPPLTEEEIEACAERTLDLLSRCGLLLRWDAARTVRTTPADWSARFPGSGGALYGPAAHAWNATLRRPGARSRLPGLYLAGGSVHPGAGVPMAALSGRMAAAQLVADQPSTRRSRPVAMPGGTWTRSATTAATP